MEEETDGITFEVIRGQALSLARKGGKGMSWPSGLVAQGGGGGDGRKAAVPFLGWITPNQKANIDGHILGWGNLGGSRKSYKSPGLQREPAPHPRPTPRGFYFSSSPPALRDIAQIPGVPRARVGVGWGASSKE